MDKSFIDFMSPKEQKEIIRLGKELFRTVCSQYIEIGLMKNDYSDFSELEKDFKAIIDKCDFEETIIDHTNDLEEEGKRYLANKQYMFACIDFSIWTEHFLNNFIHKICKRNKIDEECVIGLIRKCNIEDKCSWIMKLINGPKINPKYNTTINKLNNYRNYFVHYKWQSISDEFNSQMKEIICAYPKTISYLKRIESNYLYSGNKNRVSKLIGKKIRKSSS